MKYLFFLMLCTLAISGCEQNNSKAKADCVIEASKAPTKEGVEWGVAACNMKYNK
jgi:hypothetical protein